MKFRTQTAWMSVSNCVIQMFLAISLSMLFGWHWHWIFPALMLALLPRALKRSWVIIDEEGVRTPQHTLLIWDDIVSLHQRRWTRTVFVMKNGKKQSVFTFDWPTEHTQRFHALVEEKGL